MNPLPMRDKESTPPEPTEGPGRRLRAARQAKGIGLDKVASQLHLGQHLLEALEQDDYERLPGAVFVRGYIRNYARLLGIDEDPLLGAYYARQPAPQAATPRVIAAPQPEIRSNHLGIRLVSWVLVLGLLALLGFWVQGRFDWQNRSPGQRAVTSTPVDSLPLAGAGAQPADVPPNLNLPDTSFRGEPGPVPAAAPAPVVVEEPPPPRPQGVSLEFTGNTWVEVRDAKTKVILTGQINKGDKRTLEGTPPFTLLLNNKTRVQISVNGEPFTLPASANLGNNRARVTIDPTKFN